MNMRQIFPENFKKAIDNRGMTQTDIAIAVGVTAATVSEWAKGKKYPRPDKMQRIADILHVSMSWLTTGVDASTGRAQVSQLDALEDLCSRLNDAALERVLEYARDLVANPSNRK